MDYGTYFFANIASVTVYMICTCLLVLYKRQLVGLRWLAGSLIVGLAKLILQGLEGKAPAIFTSMIPNELYLLSFVMQLIGFRWFIVRKPVRRQWFWGALALILVLYTIFYLNHVPYSGNVINIPFVIVCGYSAWYLIRYGKGPFQMLSRVTALIFIADMVVSGYRAILTNLHYMRPWETVNAQTDPRWLYSLAGMAFLATFMMMCYLGFLVAELGRELATQARTDSLTGALTRRAIEEIALREVSRSLRHGHPLSMIMIDVDNFKRLNDTRGHAAGDCALRALAGIVRSTLRAADQFARTGGEEFAILLPDTTAAEGHVTAERIRSTIAQFDVPFEGAPFRITISAGVTQLCPTLDGWEMMMSRADAAMYAAKQHGRNQVLDSPAFGNIKSVA